MRATGQSVRLVSNGSGEVDGVITINNTQITVFTLTVDGAGRVEFTVLYWPSVRPQRRCP